MMSFLPAFLLVLLPSQRTKVIFVFVSVQTFYLTYLGVDKEVDRIATDSAKLVSAYNNLKVSHQNELPHVIDQVKQHITDLESVLSRSDDT